MRVNLYLDDDVWKKFKRRILLEKGNIRSLSSGIEELMSESSIEDSFRKGFEQMKIEIKPVVSSEVVAVKPKVQTSSGAVIRKMRNERFC